ncbi:hypothetical protein HPB52_007693 [Rhipicephalus sanguineus]|uniref:Uncharacterized protein n=1 Tax=Rhipicephalus sanguineus TaxID=34632 RepID=A0A9D4PIH7_RHISA|nr:hypothetical protein HPB52_007693 [Rhipicephalus sanguineus]
MGIRTNSTQMFPPDGLCEYLFYDSLYKEGRNTFDAPDQFDTNLRTFVDIAPTYKTTAFGIGFSYNSAFHLQFYLRQQVTKKFNVMQHFWDHSIYHIGVLDSATVDPREVDIVPALNCLKTTAAESIVRLSGLKLKSALSVTLSGHLAVLTDPKNRGFLAPCMTNNSVDSFASYAEVCKSPNYTSPATYDPSVDAAQFRHAIEPIVFSYDDRKGLNKKLCAIKEEHTITKFGIAVFDVDYADFSNVCKSRGGPFARLRLVRSVLNFFRTRVT